MKLELKHLAPYLPYSLKVVMEGKKTNVAWMSTKHIAIIRPSGIGEYKKIAWKNAHLNIQPILRPLSDLTKEIEVNGEKFVPIEIMNELSELNCVNRINNNDPDNLYFSITEDKVYFSDITTHHINNLFEWHFDVFGLIEKGLAIDINTLNK